VGERLRALASDWSVSLASEAWLSASRKSPSWAVAGTPGAGDAGVARAGDAVLAVGFVDVILCEVCGCLEMLGKRFGKRCCERKTGNSQSSR